MHIVIVAATPFEMAPLVGWLNDHFEQGAKGRFVKKELEVQLLVTGVGMPLAAFHLGRLLASEQADWLLQMGIAGSFVDRLPIGSVVNVVADRFADLGVEEANGRFTDIYELELLDANSPPFQNGILTNHHAAAFDFLPKATGITVNKVHGSSISIEKIRQKYLPDVETMEGAAFHYACLVAQKPYLQIRGISNLVEPRNRDGWNLPLAIDRVNEAGIQIIESWLEVEGPIPTVTK